MLIKVAPQDHVDIKARAAAAGLTLSEYLIALLHRDTVDEHGRPTWATRSPVDQEQLALPA